MAWQDPKTPDTKLKIRLHPWTKTGWVLKIFGVGLSLMFIIWTVGLIYSLLTRHPAAEVFFLIKGVLGLGFLLALYFLIARITRVWEKL